ncbi:MAG: ribosome hibernation-promoting factor, HPF/YfiA family [Phycisphaerales bacterium]
MRIDVSGKHMEVTPAILEYATKKCDRFTKFYDGTQQIQVVVEQLPKDKFEVELRVDVEKHPTFIATHDGDDLYKCIDGASDKMVRQLHDFKERLKQEGRH